MQAESEAMKISDISGDLQEEILISQLGARWICLADSYPMIK